MYFSKTPWRQSANAVLTVSTQRSVNCTTCLCTCSRRHLIVYLIEKTLVCVPARECREECANCLTDSLLSIESLSMKCFELVLLSCFVSVAGMERQRHRELTPCCRSQLVGTCLPNLISDRLIMTCLMPMLSARLPGAAHAHDSRP